MQITGLLEVPGDVLKMKDLKRLKLDFNDKLSFRYGFHVTFKNLVSLSLRSCKMPHLPENIYIMEMINTLCLEENRFETLPQGIVELTTLTKLGEYIVLVIRDCYRLMDY